MIDSYVVWLEPAQPMDPETGCGLPSTGEKARLLIGRARWLWNPIGPITAPAFKGTSMDKVT